MELINKIKETLIAEICPSKVYLFGSRAKGTNRDNSDFDFAVDCDSLSMAQKRHVLDKIEHIAGLYSVDIIYFTEVDKNFAEIIKSSGELIYDKRK